MQPETLPAGWRSPNHLADRTDEPAKTPNQMSWQRMIFSMILIKRIIITNSDLGKLEDYF